MSVGGERYIGQFADGGRGGTGICEYVNGDVYEGEWLMGERCGQGTCAYIVGAMSPALTKKQRRAAAASRSSSPAPLEMRLTVPPTHPADVLADAKSAGTKVDVYTGGWQADVHDGLGQLTYHHGEVYEGEWRAGKRHGRGMELLESSGECYVGEWVDGVRQGAGSLADKAKPSLAPP